MFLFVNFQNINKMKKSIFTIICLFLFIGIISAQEETKKQKKVEKTVIIKTVDNDGKVTTKIMKGDEAVMEEGKFLIQEIGDSITIDIEITEENGTKKIKKSFIVPDGNKGENKNFDFHHFNGLDSDKCKKQDIHDHFMKFGNKSGNKALLGVHIEDNKDGVKVTKVIENSSAYSVGILAGDVITKINNKKMTNKEELIREVGEHNPGDMIEIKLERNGKSKKFNARLQGNKSELNSFMHKSNIKKFKCK